MARVIKAGGDNPQGDKARVPRRSPTRMGQTGRPVIEKVVFRAQQEAADRRAAAESKRERILTDGRQKAYRAREEAQVGGAEEAFAEAAKEAILAFRHRAERYAEAASDIEILALEVVKKILGQTPSLADEQIKNVLDAGLARLRTRRRLRIQISRERLELLKIERSLLIAALEKEPDLLLEAQADVSPGFARVVTEAGAALCAETAALELLAEALQVDESAASPVNQPPGPQEEAARGPAGDTTAEVPALRSDAEEPPSRSRIRTSRNAAQALPAREAGRAAKPLPPSQPADPSARSAGVQEGARRVRPLTPVAHPPSDRVRRLHGAPEAAHAVPRSGASEARGTPPRALPLQSERSERRPPTEGDAAQEPKDVSFHDEESFADNDLDLFADEALSD